MEITPLHVTVGLAAIAGIAWLIRLESQTRNNTTSIDDLYDHTTNRDIHHDAKWLEEKFTSIIRELRDIKDDVKSLLK